MLAKGAVIFITPIIPRRTIPGGIDARAVVEPPAPADAPPPAPATVVDTVDNVLPPGVAAGVLPPPPGINGVELRLADREALDAAALDEGLAEVEG